MKYFITAVVCLFFGLFCKAQKNSYKEYQACTSYEVRKGKVNHGKSYCVGWVTIREYKNGKKDTVLWTFGSGKSFIDDEYEEYKRLSGRGQYIVDSLKEDGISGLSDNYLTYEPIYMKFGRKTEHFWKIIGNDIFIYEYLFWRNPNENGIQLLKEFKINQ